MDVLANASMVVMRQEEDAAAILHNLQRRCPSPLAVANEDLLTLPVSPASGAPHLPEDGMAVVNNAQMWTRAEDEQLRRLAACLSPALTGIDLESMGETSEPVSPRARNTPKRPQSQWDKGRSVFSWADVATAFDGRTEVQCIQRWHKLTHPDSVKGPWSSTEDSQLTELVNRFGGKQWARIALMLPGRTGKQCRERWCNNLDPTLKKGAWTPEEDAIILQLHALLGTRWAEIAKSLPGRSDNSVKNRWYSTCSRILRQQHETTGGGEPLPNFPNLNADGSRPAPPAPLELGLHIGCSRPMTPNLSHSSSCNSLSARGGGSSRKRTTAAIYTPSPKRFKATADSAAMADGRWTHPQAHLKGPIAEESEHLLWSGGACGAESPLMCAEQLF